MHFHTKPTLKGCGGGVIALCASVVASSQTLCHFPYDRLTGGAGYLRFVIRFVIEHVEHNPFQFVLDFLNVNIVDL